LQPILEVVLPFFAIVGLGYIAGRAKLIGLQGTQGLVAFVFWFAIPCLLFRGVATRRPEDFSDIRLLIAYTIATLTIFFLVRALARRLFKLAPEYAIFHGFGSAQSNNGFLAVAMMPALFGDQAIAPLALTLFADAMFLYPLGLIMSEIARAKPESFAALARQVARTFYTNAFLIAMIAGLVVALTATRLPGPIDSFFATLGQAGPPTALFALGASLALYPVTQGSTSQIAFIAGAKLLAHPILFWAIGTWVIPLPPAHLALGIAVAALPTGINLFIFSQRYVANPGIYSASILVATAAAVITFSTVVWLVN
jgi:malonate transporter and related proteins